jgi:hypothetical protein
VRRNRRCWIADVVAEPSLRKGIGSKHVVGSSFPHWVGSDQVRYFKLSEDGKTLELSVKSGTRVTSTLTWRRVE